METSEPCPECGWTCEGERLAQRLALHRNAKHGVKGTSKSHHKRPEPAEAQSPAELFGSDDAGLDSESPFMAPPGPSAEVPPVPGAGVGSAGATAPRRRGLLDRFRKKGTTASAPVGPPTGEKPPKPAWGKPERGGRRLSAAETLADLWSGGGSLMARAGHTPTGRMLQFQGPAAGELLDDALKGSTFDKLVLQRIVGGRSTLDAVFAVVAPPAITWQMEKAMAAGDQERVSRNEAALKAVIKQSLPTMLPAMKKARKKELEQAQAMTELLDLADLEMLGVRVVDGLPVNEHGQPVDIGDIFVAMLFAEWVPPALPSAPDEREPANANPAD
jgi:hypothetical protein